MTELTQPLAAAPIETFSAVPQPDNGRHVVTFGELAEAHLAWWRARQNGGSREATLRHYDAAKASFEARHGQIVAAYWCADVASAVALTEKKRLGGHRAPTWSFHPRDRPRDRELARHRRRVAPL
jgi:hypothetical protein